MSCVCDLWSTAFVLIFAQKRINQLPSVTATLFKNELKLIQTHCITQQLARVTR